MITRVFLSHYREGFYFHDLQCSYTAHKQTVLCNGYLFLCLVTPFFYFVPRPSYGNNMIFYIISTRSFADRSSKNKIKKPRHNHAVMCIYSCKHTRLSWLGVDKRSHSSRAYLIEFRCKIFLKIHFPSTPRRINRCV